MGALITKTARVTVYVGGYNSITRAYDDDIVSKICKNARVGVGAYPDDERQIFGLVYGFDLSYDLDPPEFTHMAYYLDKYFVPSEVITRLRETAKGGRFYFDAGTTRKALWVEADDMERAFGELGLL